MVHMGLLHAIKNYNGKSSFYRYAQIYIKGSMYKELTVNYPISQIPKKERTKNKVVKYISFILADQNIVTETFI